MSTLSTLSHFMRQHKFLSYSILSGMYGFARSLNGKHDQEHDVIGDKLLIGLMNGVMYSVPPYSLFYHIKLLNRIDIKINDKDPSNHASSYEDIYSFNENVFI